MGTSSSYSGRGDRSPLLPPWADSGEWDDLFPEDQALQPDVTEPEAIPTVSQGRWGTVRSHMTNYAKGGGGARLSRGVSEYVRAKGGSARAAQASSSGRTATADLGGFLSRVVSDGAEAAFEVFGLTNIVGSPVEAVLAAIIDLLAPDGATLQDAVARAAMNSTLAELYNSYGLEDGDFSKLAAMDADGVREAIVSSVTNYIFQDLLIEVQKGIVKQEVTEAEDVALERDMKAFIEETVKLDLGRVDVLNVEWQEEEGQRITGRIYEQAFALLEAQEWRGT